jgi:hypothetical protein
VAGCCECGDVPSGSCATELVSKLVTLQFCLPLRPVPHTFSMYGNVDECQICTIIGDD